MSVINYGHMHQSLQNITMISATLFSGGGLADLGLQAVGYRSAWGIEYHQPAADIYHHNFGHSPFADLLEAYPGDYSTPD